MDSDPPAMERNIKRLKEEQSKSRNQDATVLQNLLSVTLGTLVFAISSFSKSQMEKLAFASY